MNAVRRRAGKAAEAQITGHLVLPEQSFNSPGKTINDAAFAGHHRFQIKGDVGHIHAVSREVLPSSPKTLAGFEERLRRNAAHPKTGPPELLLHLNTGSIQA